MESGASSSSCIICDECPEDESHPVVWTCPVCTSGFCQFDLDDRGYQERCCECGLLVCDECIMRTGFEDEQFCPNCE